MSRIANRPLVKPSEPHRGAQLGQVVMAILILLVPAFLFASQRANLRQADQRIGELEAELVSLREQRRLIELGLQAALNPRELDRRARTIAGLAEPQAAQVTHLVRRQGPASSVVAVHVPARDLDGNR